MSQMVQESCSRCCYTTHTQTHPRLNPKDVVVDGEELLDVLGAILTTSLEPDLHLGIVDAGEVAGTGGLVLLWVESEGVVVDTRVRVAGVVVPRLNLVEVLASLLLEAILAVENELELVKRADLKTTIATNGATESRLWSTLLSPGVEVECGASNKALVGRSVAGGDGGDVGQENLWGTELCGANNGVAVGQDEWGEGDVDVLGVGGEVPEGVEGEGTRWVARVLVAPGQLLHWVVEGQADDGGGGLIEARCHGVATGVLHLLNEVLVTLLSEAAALLSVEEHVVGPDDGVVGAEVAGVVCGTVNVEANLVVLEGDEWEVETRVAVEEEDEREVDVPGGSGTGDGLWVGEGRHLVVLNLVLIREVQLGVDAPPSLEVLVNALTTDGELNGGEGALRNPVGVEDGGVGGEVVHNGLKLGIHVPNEVTVASNGDGNALIAIGSTVDGLLNSLHGEVGVALVHRLEESNFGITGEVNILSTVQCSCSSCVATYTL